MSSALQPDDPAAEQPFISHLVELRDRLIRMLIAVGLVVLVLLPFANDIYTYVAAPLMAKLPVGSTMIATQVASPFLTPFKLALIAAVFLAMPYVLYQLWAFVAPGLYQHEKRFAFPLLVASILLFYIGVLFAYFVVFPLVFAFMAGTTPDGVAMMTDISAYLDFVLTLFFAFGAAFQIPVATILLVAIGAVTVEDLVEKRPYVIVGVFVVGMFLTPPDVFSQTLLAIPMWMLFELGILLARVMLRGRDKDASAVPAVLTPAPVAAATSSAPAFDAATAPPPPAVASVPHHASADDTEIEAESDLLHAAENGMPLADETARDEPVDDLLLRANRLRDLNNEFAARQLLYEVLERGDSDQRRVARNILRQLDEV